MLNSAFLIVWNDLLPGADEEYRRFHREEHMPERLAVPGFTLGRRYMDEAAPEFRYLTIYEVDSPAVFTGEVYREHMANPTPWMRRMSQTLHNFVRRVCRTAASDGLAIGGAAATFRFSLPDPAAAAEGLVRAAREIDGIVAAHCGVVDMDATQARTDDVQSRARPEDGDFNIVLIAECEGRAAACALMPELRRTVAAAAGGSPVAAQVYDLAFVYRPAHR